MPNNLKLRACPFCGNIELEVKSCQLFVYGGFEYMVGCDDCNCRGPRHRTEEDAIDHWNDREPEHDSPQDMGWVGQDGLP